MTTTTTLGTWCNTVDRYRLTVEGTVLTVFDSEGTDGFDIEAIVAEYRSAINDALPADVYLCGNEFYGPVDRIGSVGFAEIIEAIDLRPIIEAHHTAA